ncbi:MAG: Rpn family recombination-promoting nuclease/putative transposase [Treponema sp.]|nr:Rpn family recombination-promoting nuclease/putative transposase [Candidatus Treponema caballi]
MAQTNRNVKDSVFADLFSNEQDGKRNFLSLYNALHGTHLKYEETVIENKTIPQSMYKTFHNDVSMLIDNKLIVMIEHQSTINENMPFRLLEYVTRIYEGIVPSRDRYLKKRIQIPTPEFYVFYNGLEKYPDEKVLHLSDSFSMRDYDDTSFPQLELTVRVINIGPEQTWKFQDGCDILKQYCDFIEIVREYAVPGESESYKQAIEEAIRKGILKNYLIKNSTEVINMFLAEYDYETDVAVQREEAREDKAIEAAVTLIQKYNEQPETAAQVMGAPLDKVLEALASK